MNAHDMRRWLPSILTAFRLGLALPLYGLLLDYQLLPTLGVLALAMFSDWLDGALARRWDACTSTGAYFDATADFAVILAAFAALVAHGVYPLWLLGLLAGLFAQFLLTSALSKRPIYDPVGKYLGALLYGALVLLLLVPETLLSLALLWGIAALCAASLATRARYLWHVWQRALAAV